MIDPSTNVPADLSDVPPTFSAMGLDGNRYVFSVYPYAEVTQQTGRAIVSAMQFLKTEGGGVAFHDLYLGYMPNPLMALSPETEIGSDTRLEGNTYPYLPTTP